MPNKNIIFFNGPSQHFLVKSYRYWVGGCLIYVSLLLGFDYLLFVAQQELAHLVIKLGGQPFSCHLCSPQNSIFVFAHVLLTFHLSTSFFRIFHHEVEKVFYIHSGVYKIILVASIVELGFVIQILISNFYYPNSIIIWAMLLPIFANSYYPATIILSVLVIHCMFFYLIVVLLEIVAYVIQVLTQNRNSIIGVTLVW